MTTLASASRAQSLHHWLVHSPLLLVWVWPHALTGSHMHCGSDARCSPIDPKIWLSHHRDRVTLCSLSWSWEQLCNWLSHLAKILGEKLTTLASASLSQEHQEHRACIIGWSIHHQSWFGSGHTHWKSYALWQRCSLQSQIPRFGSHIAGIESPFGSRPQHTQL